MCYIIGTLLNKAFEDPDFTNKINSAKHLDEVWKMLMLAPRDYSYKAVHNEKTKALMNKTTFSHGGKEYDDKYPEGIPTSVKITLKDGKVLDSGFVMFPSGHAANTSADLNAILNYKFNLLGKLALDDSEQT